MTGTQGCSGISIFIRNVRGGIVLWLILGLFSILANTSFVAGAGLKPNISEVTQDCLGCHEDETPGIVADWRNSRHAMMSVKEALKQPVIARRISTDSVPDTLSSVAVGCFECHGLNPGRHQDNFEHNEYKINVVVSPNDCKTCHPVEVDQFAHSKKANAIAILKKNPLFHQLVNTIT